VRVQSGIRFRSLTPALWWYFAFLALIVLPTTIVLGSWPAPHHWYLRYFVEPELEEVLGFEAEDVELRGTRGQFSAFAIVALDRSGILGAAGVQAGDIPYGYHHGARSGFIWKLHSHRGRAVRLRFVRGADARNDRWEPYEVTVSVPLAGQG
jgi:hypothetical protein